ncbi:AraC-type DNA-binding protein [Aquimarina spongiae]|uniref:AraC-type DNA-binding protein n=2 Tax=Aquimarina spongiae TaxID=570521 RepID=A0A1M6B254_9FLAO|nr:AraC-type DNA-binding protein [Aquimarina spongiae]
MRLMVSYGCMDLTIVFYIFKNGSSNKYHSYMELFFDGMLCFLGIQLIGVSMLHFYERSNQNTIYLASICAIFGLWYCYFVFHQTWRQHFLLGILLGPDKMLFIPALLLFYFKSITEDLKTNYIVKHLTIPSIVYLASLVIRHFFPEYWPSFDKQQVPIFFIAGIAIFWYYFFLTRKALKLNLKSYLQPKVYRRFLFLFYSLYSFMLLTPAFDMLKSFWDALYTTNDSTTTLYALILEYAEDIVYLHFFFITYVFSLYALTELNFIRRLLFPNDPLLSENLLMNTEEISNLLNHKLIAQKLYQDPTINAVSFAKRFNLQKKDIVDYLRVTKKGSFIEYINRLRIEEFKRLLKDEKHKNYDLVGLALECGFTSKSTFFRVFKKQEGITPNEFKKQL